MTTARTAAVQPPLGGFQMRVLLVEDDAATAASIALMLKREGFICDTTDLGEDGLEIGKLYDYDIIILDLLLPDMDGYEVLRRRRAARAGTAPGRGAHADPDPLRARRTRPQDQGPRLRRRRLPDQAFRAARADRAHS